MKIKAAIAMSLMLALTTTGEAAKPKDLFCPNLKKAVAAASEKPAYKSLYGKVVSSYDRQATLALPGFSDCLISGYAKRQPAYDCAHKAATPAEAQALMMQTRSRIEICLGATMIKDRNRYTQPWVLRKGPTTHPFAFVNVLNETEVVVGYVSDYTP
ncbi:MAG: hypothetical protein RL299_1218 [Pseudomonadota bacterium]|jgi:hypothetical protein